MRPVRSTLPVLMRAAIALAVAGCDRGSVPVEANLQARDATADEMRALDAEVAALRLQARTDAELNAQLANVMTEAEAATAANTVDPTVDPLSDLVADTSSVLGPAIDARPAAPTQEQLRAAEAAVAAAMAKRRTGS